MKIETKTPKAKYAEIKKILAENPFGFFTITFVKKDNSVRVLNGRRGVKKHLKGGVNTVAGYSNFLTVFDCKIKEYRNVNLDKVIEIKANGNTYTF